jgi:phosphatidylglycerophosphatase A
VGRFPRLPGTAGSLVALPLAWAIHVAAGALGLAVAAGVLFLIGVWASEVVVRRSGFDDPSEIVVDEVVGQWLVLLVVAPDPLLYGLGFLLFRVFDILKPWPIGWIERRLKGGLGVMADDVAAAALAAVALATITHWIL